MKAALSNEYLSPLDQGISTFLPTMRAEFRRSLEIFEKLEDLEEELEVVTGQFWMIDQI